MRLEHYPVGFSTRDHALYVWLALQRCLFVKVSRRQFAGLPILVVFLLAFQPSLRADFQISGEMKAFVYSFNGSTQIYTRAFECLVSETFSSGRYTTTANDGKDFGEMVMEDGTIYTLRGFVVQTNGASKTNLGGYIDWRDFPIEESARFVYPCLAFGSVGYLASMTEQSARPFWMLDDPKLNKDPTYTLPTIVTRLNNSGLPRSLTFFGDGMFRLTTRTGILTRPMPAPFNVGYTNATYSVEETMILDSFELPKKAVSRRFGVTPSGTNATMRLLNEVFLTVTRAEKVVSSGPYRPRFEGRFLVVDNRFSGSNPPVKRLVYALTNGIWKDPPQLGRAYKTEQRVLKHIAEAKDRRHQQRATIPALTTALLFATLIVPGVVLYFLRRKR